MAGEALNNTVDDWAIFAAGGGGGAGGGGAASAHSIVFCSIEMNETFSWIWDLD